MKIIFRFSWLGILLLVHLIPGFSGIFLIEVSIAACILGGVTALLNDAGYIPGTNLYQLIQRKKAADIRLEIERVELTRTRLQARSNEEIAHMLTEGTKHET